MPQWPRLEPDFPFAAWSMTHLLRRFARFLECFGNGSKCLGQICLRLGSIVFAMRRYAGLGCGHCASCVLDPVNPIQRPIRSAAPLDLPPGPRPCPPRPQGTPKVCWRADFPFHPANQLGDDPMMQRLPQSWSALRIAHRFGQPSGFRRDLSPVCASARSWISVQFPAIPVTDASATSMRYL